MNMAAAVESPSSTLQMFPHVNDNPSMLSPSIDPFTITSSTGFLPCRTPPTTLPVAFKALASLLDRLPVMRNDGSPGLLAEYTLGPTVLAELPDLTDEIDKLVADDGKPDLFTVTALFRDYAFLASAYLLEPCWENWRKNPDGSYGLGRSVLPKSVARPMYYCAQLLDIPPFLSYAASYCLFNYTFDEPSMGLQYSNLRLIRGFECGQDPKSSEAGFILTHVDMVKESPALIGGTLKVLNTLEKNGGRSEVNEGFRDILGAMEKIEACMENMWKNSKPMNYLSFRIFIFGITSQSMFPDGVIYEGVSDNPMHFRGESGANDSIIPLLDHLLQIPMPDTPLTKILHEFRAYRPLQHRRFLAHVAASAEKLAVRDFAVQDKATAILYLKALDHIRSFRWRHWLFAREYIIRRTLHPTATGGSPIVTWLPNQLFAVMDLMISIYDTYLSENAPITTSNPLLHEEASDVAAAHRKQLSAMVEQVRDQREKLTREVEKWCKERSV